MLLIDYLTFWRAGITIDNFICDILVHIIDDNVNVKVKKTNWYNLNNYSDYYTKFYKYSISRSVMRYHAFLSKNDNYDHVVFFKRKNEE